MKLSKEQEDGISSIIGRLDSIFLVSGSAGTGKSFFIQHLVKALQEQKRQYLLSAPTGKASSLINGYTIDYLFGLPTRQPFDPDRPIRNQRYHEVTVRYFKSDVLQAGDVFIIDEISMLRCDKMDAIDAALKQATKNEKPFGGKTMVFVGDTGQLHPVATEKDKKVLDLSYEMPYTYRQSRIFQDL